jgi:ABC-type nickel/cobalt efflux system permease component RcnA
MEQWSAVFTIAALAGVLLTLVGAWWMVRVLRAKRPRPGPDEQRSHSDHPTR